MGGWYTVGLFLGLGVALGVALAGFLPPSRVGILAAAVAAGAVVAAIGAGLAGSPETVAGGAGGIVGAAGTAPLVRSTLGRGGTRAGTGLLIALGAVVLAALAFVPVAGYVEAVAVPALAARLRRRAGRTYAGLRILARD